MLPTHRRFASPRQIPSPSFLSEAKNSWITIAFLVAAQCLGTLYASLVGGPLPHNATNTDLLYDRSLTLFMTMFLTFQTNSVFGFLLAVYNAALLTALLGWPQACRHKIFQKEMLIHVASVLGIIGVRMLFGYLFGRGTGFAYPVLFFNDAIHETTCGLSVIILYCVARRAYDDSSSEKSRLFLPSSLLLWSPNALRGPVFFWSFSTACVTGIQELLSLLLQRQETVWNNPRMRSADSKSKSTRLRAKLRTFFVLSTLFVSISYLHFVAHGYNHDAHSRRVASLPEPVLTQFLLLSYPRRNDSTLLSSTLQSYAKGLGSRFTTQVYTTVEPTSHSAFRDAQTDFKGTPGLDFFSDPNPDPLLLSRPVIPGYLPGKQTLDLYSALSWTERNIRSNDTRYIGIMEDDFEWCEDGWDELKAILYEVALKESLTPSEDRFCGIFVATGGSGLIVRPSAIPLLKNALHTYAFDFNTDIILQDCLRGSLPICSGCRLAASRRLLFRHTGASQSTYRGRSYPEDRWQCGWRQPFNGKLGIWVP